MSREQRIFDNWALYFCIKLAKQKGVGVEIVYNLDPNFLGGTLRQLDFKCRSLREVAATAHEMGIPFSLVQGPETEKDIASFAQELDAKVLVTDFSPLKIARKWIE